MTVTISLLTLSACRVRNHQSTTLKGYDTLSGYYSTNLQTITGTVKLKSESDSRIHRLPVAQAVESYVAVFADPPLLYFDNPLKNMGTIRNHADPSLGIPIIVDPDSKSLSFSREAKGTIDQCNLIGSETRIGSFNGGVVGTKNGYNTRGTMSLSLKMGYTFQSDLPNGCDLALTDFFEKCFNDPQTCTDSENELIHSIFDRYVNGGIIKNNEIHLVESVSIEMKYE